MRDVALQDRTYFYDKINFSPKTGFSVQLVPQEVQGVTAVDVQDHGQHVLRTASGDVRVKSGWRAVEIDGGAWTFTGTDGKGPALETVPRQRQDIAFITQVEGQTVRSVFSVGAITEMAESPSGTRYLTCEDGRRYMIAAGNREITVELTPPRSSPKP